jgi:cbb3-type cytochrome oxidase subunit 3
VYSTETYLRWHRGLTHSVLLLPFWAALIAMVFWAFSRDQRFRPLWLLAAVGIGSHLLLDLLTNYGTMLFAPVSDARFALSWVFILDPYVWALLGVVLWVILRVKVPRAAPAGLMLFGGYFLVCGIAHTCALHAARARGNADRVAAYAMPLNPFRFAVVQENGNAIEWRYGGRTDYFVQFRDNKLCPQAEATETVKLFRWFAEFPLVEKLDKDGHTMLRYRDLRFRTILPWGEIREGAFVVAEIVFDDHGQILSTRLVRNEH